MAVLKRNIDGEWKLVEIQEVDVKHLQRETFDKNKAIMDLVKKEMEEGYTEGERIAVFATLARHYHYAIEEEVDARIKRGDIR